MFPPNAKKKLKLSCGSSDSEEFLTPMNYL